MENESLKLLQAPPQERLTAWLSEIYGKPVEVVERQLLRHRDLSYVERIRLADAIPESLIYKVVLPPWDIEQDLHERILIPEVSSSARLYLSGFYKGSTALFLEDLGTGALMDEQSSEAAVRLGADLAKLHRAFTYRIAEIQDQGILRRLPPQLYVSVARELTAHIRQAALCTAPELAAVTELASVIADALADEPISLVHGDLYAENVLINCGKVFIIDWSWFTIIGAPIMDLATLTMNHPKNGCFQNRRDEVIEAYCGEYSRPLAQVHERLPYAEALSRLLLLQWLIERRSRGIMGTTIGPVDTVIPVVVRELGSKLSLLSA
ncbi:MAG: phosphotransferase [Candidatus Obscuribacterales bacterium]|nr:phosphotransferase [Candidatus Obscuribacterales bacterium]